MSTAAGQPVTLWTGGGYELAECARWTGERLIFVDILTGRLLQAPGAAPGNARLLAQLDVPLGAAAPITGTSDEWIVAAGTGIALLYGSGRLRWIDRPEEAAAVPTRMNDGTCDPHGRFWAGSMAYDNTPGAGSLYRLDSDGTVTQVLDGMTIINGPAFSADGSRMYVTDTAAGRIYSCTIDTASGEITEQHLFIEIPTDKGAPDGMTVDNDGRLWVAIWDGSSVRCYEPDASLHRVLRVPAPRPTSVCIGGPTGERLFVTTARHGIHRAAAESGGVLSCPIQTTAPAASAFGNAASLP